jgi:hypothetical protein
MSAHWPVKWEEPTEVILQKQQETVGILAACGGEDVKDQCVWSAGHPPGATDAGYPRFFAPPLQLVAIRRIVVWHGLHPEWMAPCFDM